MFLLSFVFSILLKGLYSDGFLAMPTRVADSSIFRESGVVLKYIFAADSIPTARFKKSNLFRYIEIISFFEYWRSILRAIIHSLNFCFTLSNLDFGFSEKNILANCWVNVLPPPRLRFPVITPFNTLRRAMKSIPE